MNEIKFTASFGDEKKKVWLSYDQWGTKGWGLNIDGYYNGLLTKRDGDWISYSEWIYGDDVFILGEIIDAYLKDNGIILDL